MKTENTFIVHTETAEQENALIAFVKALKIKFEVAKKSEYDPDFVAKIEHSKKEYEAGNFTTIAQEDIEDYLSSK